MMRLIVVEEYYTVTARMTAFVIDMKSRESVATPLFCGRPIRDEHNRQVVPGTSSKSADC